MIVLKDLNEHEKLLRIDGFVMSQEEFKEVIEILRHLRGSLPKESLYDVNRLIGIITNT